MMNIREAILDQFLHEQTLSFSAIRKALDVPSNKLSYHLQQLVEEDLLEKVDDSYVLTEEAKDYLPYFDMFLGTNKYPIVVAKPYFYNDDACVLTCREKEPFHSYWELPATKVRLGEGFGSAVERVKTGLDIQQSSSIEDRTFVREIIHKEGGIAYDYFLYFLHIPLEQHESMVERDEAETRNMIPTDALFLQDRLEEKRIELAYQNGTLERR